ncbi:MAG TPA: hypothetical protein VKI01_13745 [Acidimicrobiia bacterium]|nr:hypothetical protein [Acidimicrobiia bacterium]
MSTTPPGPPPGPPPAPPPGPPSGPPWTAPQPAAAPPKKKSGRGIWLVLFVVAAVLFVGALVFAIISFTGKNSEADDKEKAQRELASTKKELESTQTDLGSSQRSGRTLRGLLTQAASAADTLKSCTDSSGSLREGMIEAINVVQNGGTINDRIDALNQQIDGNRGSCSTSDQAYQDLLNALNEARGK